MAGHFALPFVPSGIYAASAVPSYGGYNPYAMSTVASSGYGSYVPYTGGYGSYAALSTAPSQDRGSSVPPVPSASDVEVSGPLDRPPPHRAIVRLRLPVTWASVSFDGRKADEYGKRRTYVTPELREARTFTVVATWKANGRPVQVSKQVSVDAGQVRTLDFTSDK
jgi:uncharacterized protein (TIGR03000 family)